MKFHHIGIEVQDLYTVEKFFRKVLGFTPNYRYVSRNQPGLRTVFLSRDGIQVELLERPRRVDFLSDRVPVRGHLALQSDDVDREYNRLLALGIPAGQLEPPRNTGDGFRELTLRDPEGNLIELCSRVGPEPHYGVGALLFDLDGTLIDSEENYYLADRQLLAKRGIEFTESDKRRYIGGSNVDMMVDLVRRFGLPETPSALCVEKNEVYMQIARQQTHLFPEMKRFWDMVRSRGIPLAVVSGSSPGVIHELLALVGVAGDAEVIVSAEEVERGKPAPDAFLEAARRLSIPAERCVVVEDSRYGVEAASRAFMRCIAVPYLHDEPLDDAFDLADLLFERGMDNFDADRALAWLDAESEQRSRA